MCKAMRFPSRFPTHIFLILVLGTLFYTTSTQPVQADAAPPPDPALGGAVPYQPIKTNVQMMSETVILNLLANPDPWTPDDDPWTTNQYYQIQVSASFTMQNQGSTEENMQVLFPLTRLDYPWLTSTYNIISSSFIAKVDGQLVPTAEINTPPELTGLPTSGQSYPPDGSYVPDVRWAAFDVTFPVHKKVLLQVEYTMDGYTLGSTQIDYILETGAGWYGNILSADIIVRLPYPASTDAVPFASPGYTFSGNEVRWGRKNFEPKRVDNFLVKFINTNYWQTVLDQRARTVQDPQNADAWYKLGDVYAILAVGYSATNPDFYIQNPYYADLSIKAFEKAIALRPDWGEAHYQLANILWINNPNVAKRVGQGRVKSNIPVDDPSIQRVLQELKLAWFYGIPPGFGRYGLVDDINSAIPGLDLTSPTPAIPTPIPSTDTPQPSPTGFNRYGHINSAIPGMVLPSPALATRTPVPSTDTHLLSPTARPVPTEQPTQTLPAGSTPVRTKVLSFTMFGGLAVGLLVAVALLVYLWKSKRGGRS